jgi:hypothetical protein
MKRLLFLSLLLSVPLWAVSDAYQQKAERELDTLSQRIETLKNRSYEAGHQTREEVDATVTRLQEKLAAARKKLDDLKLNTEEKGKPFKTSLDQTIKDLRQAYHKAVSRLK